MIFFWPFHHSKRTKRSSSFFCGLFWAKTRKRKKYNNKGCQEIIGLILFGKKSKDNCHTSKCCGVMSPHRKEHQIHFLFIFLIFTPRLLRVAYPRYQVSLLLLSRRGSWEQGSKKHGDDKLLNADNYLLFWSQKVFLMAGRSPLKCDNSNWLSIEWFGTIHTENGLWNSAMEPSMFDMCVFNVGDNL